MRFLAFLVIRNFLPPVLEGECKGYRGTWTTGGKALEITEPTLFGSPLTTGRIAPLLHVFSDYLTASTNKTLVQNQELHLRMRNPDEAEQDIARFCPEFLDAYRNLQFIAYKADLWRNCVLWALGKMCALLK